MAHSLAGAFRSKGTPYIVKTVQTVIYPVDAGEEVLELRGRLR